MIGRISLAGPELWALLGLEVKLYATIIPSKT
jgi:hypothetical protein